MAPSLDGITLRTAAAVERNQPTFFQRGIAHAQLLIVQGELGVACAQRHCHECGGSHESHDAHCERLNSQRDDADQREKQAEDEELPVDSPTGSRVPHGARLGRARAVRAFMARSVRLCTR